MTDKPSQSGRVRQTARLAETEVDARAPLPRVQVEQVEDERPDRFVSLMVTGLVCGVVVALLPGSPVWLWWLGVGAASFCAHGLLIRAAIVSARR